MNYIVTQVRFAVLHLMGVLNAPKVARLQAQLDKDNKARAKAAMVTAWIADGRAKGLSYQQLHEELCGGPRGLHGERY